jgi:putative endonuclease
MHYVYILESISTPGRFYIGYTMDLRERIRKHQADVSSHAAKYRPWKLKAYFAFETEEIATRFERYLKSGSGRGRGRVSARRDFRPTGSSSLPFRKRPLRTGKLV